MLTPVDEVRDFLRMCAKHADEERRHEHQEGHIGDGEPRGRGPQGSHIVELGRESHCAGFESPCDMVKSGHVVGFRTRDGVRRVAAPEFAWTAVAFRQEVVEAGRFSSGIRKRCVCHVHESARLRPIRGVVSHANEARPWVRVVLLGEESGRRQGLSRWAHNRGIRVGFVSGKRVSGERWNWRRARFVME